MIVYGYHTVAAILTSEHKVHCLHVQERESAGERSDELLKIARERRIEVQTYSLKDKQGFAREFKRAGGQDAELASAQGIFITIPEPQCAELAPLLAALDIDTRPYPLFVLLDEISDPQNLGSILRSAAAFAASGIIVTEHRSSPLNAVVARISSGGFAHVPICRVTNLNQAMELLKEKGFWLVGLSEHAKDTIDSVRLDAPLCLLIGNEEKGLRQLTEKNCDWLVRLPTNGVLQSLNAAVACASTMALVRQAQSQIS